MFEDRAMLPVEITNKLTDKLIEALGNVFEGNTFEQVIEKIRPIIPSVINLAYAEGIDAAEDTLIGLATAEDSYPYWRTIIKSCNANERVALMETARQQAVAETLAEIKEEQERWAALLVGLKVLVSILPLLL